MKSYTNSFNALTRIAIDPQALEAAPETLAQLHPYFFDIAQHEALTQRTFRLGNQTFRFDMLRRDTGIPGRPPAEILELKRGGHAQSQGHGLSQFEYQAAEQVEHYLEALSENDDLARLRLKSSFRNARTRVVGGHARGSDSAALKRGRARFPQTVIEGWDDVERCNRLRYGVPTDGEPSSDRASSACRSRFIRDSSTRSSRSPGMRLAGSESLTHDNHGLRGAERTQKAALWEAERCRSLHEPSGADRRGDR